VIRNPVGVPASAPEPELAIGEEEARRVPASKRNNLLAPMRGGVRGQGTISKIFKVFQD